jgi:hypothetical protein
MMPRRTLLPRWMNLANGTMALFGPDCLFRQSVIGRPLPLSSSNVFLKPRVKEIIWFHDQR